MNIAHEARLSWQVSTFPPHPKCIIIAAQGIHANKLPKSQRLKLYLIILLYREMIPRRKIKIRLGS